MKAKLSKVLSEHPAGLNYRGMAMRLLKARDISDDVSQKVLSPFLLHEANFVCEENGLWRTREPQDPRDRLLDRVTFVIFDLETTGSKLPGDRITEIGAVKVRGGKPLEEFQHLVNPGRYIPWSVQRLTGIYDTTVQDEPPVDEILPLFSRFARGAVLVAHNAAFDLRFLAWEGKRLGLDFSHPSLCTCRLSRRLFGNAGDYRLGSLAGHLGLRVGRRHRALFDARTTSRLLLALLKRLEERGVEVLGDLLDYEKGPKARRPKASPDQLRSSPSCGSPRRGCSPLSAPSRRPSRGSNRASSPAGPSGSRGARGPRSSSSAFR